MDLDIFIAAHREEWDRLDTLVRRRRRLGGTEIDELVELYQKASTHLSVVRSHAMDPTLVARLSGLVARARSAVTGVHTPAWREVGRFVMRTFPAALYRSRWWSIGAGLGFVLFAAAVGAWVASEPRVQAAMGTPEQVRQIVEHEFANYYVEYDSASFAAQVWTNNALVAAQALVLGAFLVIPAAAVLALNAANVGAIGGLMIAHDRAGVFFGLLLPHGMLELAAVFVAAGAGMKLGWTLIEPGPRPRGRAMAEEGRAAIAVALGLVGVLLVAGIIEGFVTGYVAVTWLRIGIGAVAFAAFVLYIAVLGRRAVAAGETGDMMDRPAAAPVAG